MWYSVVSPFFANVYISREIEMKLLIWGVGLPFNRWVVEYHIDGFLFHSLSSMIYTHNGFASFTGDMEE